MSGGGTETPVACEAAQGGGGGGKKRDSLGTPGAAHLIIKGTEWRAWSSVRGRGACGARPSRGSLARPPPSAAWPDSVSAPSSLPGPPEPPAKGAQVGNGNEFGPHTVM